MRQLQGMQKSAAAFGLVAMLLGRGAWAICVSDQAGFAGAIVEAEFLPVTIELVQGSYAIAGTAFDNTSATFQGFSLLGGYTDNCASRAIDPTNTTITVGAGTDFVADVIGDVTIEGVRINGAHAGVNLDWDDYFHDIPPSVNLSFRRNIVNGATSGGVTFYWAVGGSQTFSARVVENLIHDNSAGSSGYCALELQAVEGADATFTLVNNTIMNNTVGDGGVCAGRYGGDEGSVLGFNNVLYANAHYDLASNTSLLLYNNLIGGHNGYPVGTIEFATLSVDPKLDGSFHPIESPASPVINSGYDNVPGGLPAHDLTGGPRIIGSSVDRGVYESAVDDQFIQTVSNTDDSGTGSLRAAIAGVNAHGSGLIKFDIGSGCGPHIITVDSALPAITATAYINGYTQTGSAQNDLDVGDDATICVIVENGGSATVGLQVPSNAGDGVAATIKGLAFSGFSDTAIDLQGGSGHFVGGNHFGGNVGGHTLQDNGVNIRLGIAEHDSAIGSEDVGDRNIIGDASSDGILLQGGASGPLVIGAYNNQIVNNYIGLGWSINASNYTNRANGSNGVRIDGHDNTLSGNLIGNNVIDGVVLNGEGAVGNAIRDNFIGASAAGTNVGNGSMGVRTQNDAHDNRITGNTIADNGQKGVRILTGRGNRIRKNSIYGNALLGIDLAGEGVTPNDDDGGIEPSDFANRGQNFPVLTSATGGYASGTVSGTLTTTPGDYIVDLYVSPACNSLGNGDGKFWLGGVKVSVPTPQVGDQGTLSFNLPIRQASIAHSLQSGQAITATATDAADDTSEFSACTSYVNDTIFANGFEAAPK